MSEPHEASQPPASTWHKVAKPADVPKGRGRIYRAGNRKIAVFKAEGKYYALDNRCPHAGAALGLGSVKGLVVTCPRHNWLFNLHSGSCLTDRAFDVRTYPVRVRDGWLEVLVDEPVVADQF